MNTRAIVSLIIPAAVAALALGTTQAEAAREEQPQVGIVEHLGERVPMDLTFRDENGKEVRLGDVIDRPTILSLVYYNCPGICTPLLQGKADVIDKLDLVPGKDYRAVTISFDPSDTSALAKAKKQNYLNLLSDESFDPENWKFLVGDQKSIDAITQAVGFGYQKTGRDYAHSASLFVLSPDGKIARYLYGTTFLPFDMKMALVEASKGKVGPTINKILLYCFAYDPDGRGYALQTTRIAGVTVLLTATLLVAYLGATTRRRQAARRQRFEGQQEDSTNGS